MLSEPTTILFETQLGWPPPEVLAFRVDKKLVRKLYNRLHAVEHNEFAYDNIDLQTTNLTLTHKHDAGGSSRCSFDESSVSIVEEQPQLTLEEFLRRVQTVCSAFAEVCRESSISVPPILIQRCRIHCLAQPHDSSNALKLLAGKVARVSDKTSPFGRPPAFFGVRFRFFPATVQAEGNESEKEHRDYCAIRFETYAEDLTKVWMEIASTSFFRTVLDLSGNDIAKVKDGIRDAYKFLTESCKSFLDQFDISVADDNHHGEGGDDEQDS